MNEEFKKLLLKLIETAATEEGMFMVLPSCENKEVQKFIIVNAYPEKVRKVSSRTAFFRSGSLNYVSSESW